MFRLLPALCASILLISAGACRQHPAEAKAIPAEKYISDPNSVGFDIAQQPTNDGSRQFLATYSDQGKTARFVISLAPSKSMDPEAGGLVKMSSGQGAILALSGSDAGPMLVALMKALEAKHLPAHVQRASRLPFDYVILGEQNSQVNGGGMTVDNKGNWTAMKIFIGEGEDESEVFLNFNTVSGKAQFSEKDIDYGDAAVAKLATVL
jgi:hypothetical protein